MIIELITEDFLNASYINPCDCPLSRALLRITNRYFGVSLGLLNEVSRENYIAFREQIITNGVISNHYATLKRYKITTKWNSYVYKELNTRIEENGTIKYVLDLESDLIS